MSADPFANDAQVQEVVEVKQPSPSQVPQFHNTDIASLQDSMNNFDATTTITQQVRSQLMTKFLPDILAMDMKADDKTDPDLYASKARFLSEFRGLLSDIDSSSKNHVHTKLKQKDSETQAANAINAAEFLSKIKLTGGVPMSPVVPASEEEVKRLMEKQFEDKGCIVLDTELSMGENNLPEKEENEEF